MVLFEKCYSRARLRWTMEICNFKTKSNITTPPLKSIKVEPEQTKCNALMHSFTCIQKIEQTGERAAKGKKKKSKRKSATITFQQHFLGGL